MTLTYGKLLLVGECFADAAERLRRDAEVGRNLILGDALEQFRIHFQKGQILLFCGKAECCSDSSLLGDKAALQKKPEEAFKWRNLRAEFLLQGRVQ